MILEKTPPELAKDIIHSGIYITGGGSQLAGLDQLFEQITGIKVICSECPEESAVRGLVQIVSDSNIRDFRSASKIITEVNMSKNFRNRKRKHNKSCLQDTHC